MWEEKIKMMQLNQLDAVVTGAVSNKFSIGYNGSVRFLKPVGESNNSWWGSAVYFNYDPTSVFGLTAKRRILQRSKMAWQGLEQTFSILLFPEIFILIILTIIPEFRLDAATDAVILYK